MSKIKIGDLVTFVKTTGSGRFASTEVVRGSVAGESVGGGYESCGDDMLVVNVRHGDVGIVKPVVVARSKCKLVNVMNKNVIARTLENGRLEFWCSVCEEGVGVDFPAELTDFTRLGELFADDHQHPFVGSDTKLLPYRAFSKLHGPSEGSILVFALGIQTAKFMAWQSGECLNVDDYSDLAIHEIVEDEPDGDGGDGFQFPIEQIVCLGDNGKLAANEPHVVADPQMCVSCNVWGGGLANDDKCGQCNQHPGDALVALIRGIEVKEYGGRHE